MGRRIDIAGLTAVVTGASSGIGLEFSRQLAAAGARLLMVSNQPEALRAEAEALRNAGAVVDALCLDLTRAESIAELFEYIDSRDLGPDILINNAGIFAFSCLTDIPEGKVNAFVDLHVRATTLLARGCAERMKRRGRGYILNMSSMSCWAPMPGLSMYSATKAYIRVMSRALHYEMRDCGVGVTVACPGGISTSLFGLPDNLMRLALRLRAVDTPERFVAKALRKMFARKQQYINGPLNRLAIVGVGLAPTWMRMLVKHKMLDKNIVRP